MRKILLLRCILFVAWATSAGKYGIIQGVLSRAKTATERFGAGGGSRQGDGERNAMRTQGYQTGNRLAATAVVALSAVALCALADAASLSLMPCPDCEAKVSRRALMCPSCGCRGEAIEEAARALAEAEKPKKPDREVAVKVNRTI